MKRERPSKLFENSPEEKLLVRTVSQSQNCPAGEALVRMVSKNCPEREVLVRMVSQNCPEGEILVRMVSQNYPEGENFTFCLLVSDLVLCKNLL